MAKKQIVEFDWWNISLTGLAALAILLLISVYLKKLIKIFFDKFFTKYEKEEENFENIKIYSFHSIIAVSLLSLSDLFDLDKYLYHSIVNVKNIAISLYITTSLSLFLITLINHAEVKYKPYFDSKKFPIKLPLQILKWFIIACTIVICISRIANISPASIITSLGATTAIITYVFKDTITGLIASVQLIMQNKIQVGDSISVLNLQIDGTVENITMNEVMIRSSSGALITVPASTILASNIKNYRAYAEAQKRQIRRLIYIDVNSIKYASKEQIELCKTNFSIELSENVKPTNIDLFRKFIEYSAAKYLDDKTNYTGIYIKEQDGVSPGIIILEVIIYLKKIDLENYEKYQSEIFSQMISAMPEFKLKTTVKQ